LRVWLPPEVYLHARDLALREADRWRATFRIPARPPEYSPTARAVHLVQSVFPDPWRACPIWVGTTWSVRAYPRLKIELMAADEQEATEWLRRRLPKHVSVHLPTQIEFERRGIVASAGIHRLKRVSGF